MIGKILSTFCFAILMVLLPLILGKFIVWLFGLTVGSPFGLNCWLYGFTVIIALIVLGDFYSSFKGLK